MVFLLASLGQIQELGGTIRREYSLDMQVGSCINQPVLLHVNKESEMFKKICTEDGFPHISDNKNP